MRNETRLKKNEKGYKAPLLRDIMTDSKTTEGISAH